MSIAKLSSIVDWTTGGSKSSSSFGKPSSGDGAKSKKTCFQGLPRSYWYNLARYRTPHALCAGPSDFAWMNNASANYFWVCRFTDGLARCFFVIVYLLLAAAWPDVLDKRLIPRVGTAEVIALYTVIFSRRFSFGVQDNVGCPQVNLGITYWGLT